MLTSPPALRPRLLVALAAAAFAAVAAYGAVHSGALGATAADFTFYWRAGRAVLAHQSPYAVINPSGPYPFNEGFYYTLPVALLSAPMALLPIHCAFILFAGVTTAVLAYAVTQDGYWRLPLLASFPMFWSVTSGTWTPLATAALLLPWYGALAVGKPTIGVAVWLGSRTWHACVILAVAGALALIISVALYPYWPVEYLREIRTAAHSAYRIPALVWRAGGPLLLVALTRWRDDRARLLVAMSLVPQAMFFYDQLPLITIARSYRQALVFALWSWVPVLVAPFLPARSDNSMAATTAVTSLLIVGGYYLPLLVWVVARPNHREMPAAATLGHPPKAEVVGADHGGGRRTALHD